MSEKLKPCPGCGCTHLHFEIGIFRVSCGGDCLMKGPKKDSMEDAIAAWNALPRPLRWTKELPTEPGWYWFRNLSKPQIVHLNGVKDRKPHPADEWAGPIQEPVTQLK